MPFYEPSGCGGCLKPSDGSLIPQTFEDDKGESVTSWLCILCRIQIRSKKPSTLKMEQAVQYQIMR